MLSWKIFSHYLLSRRSGALIRTVAWMTMGGIAVGVAALIIVVGVMNGFNKVIRDRHLKAEPHLVIHAPELLSEDTGRDNLDHNQLSSEKWFEKAQKDIQDELSHQIESISPFLAQDVIVKSMDGYFSGAVAKGLTSGSLLEMRKRIDPESVVSASDQENDVASRQNQWELGEDEVLIGRDLGESLRIYSGDIIVLIAPEVLLLPAGEAPPPKSLKVKGLFNSQLQDLDGRLILFNNENSLLAKMDLASQSRGVEIRLKQGEKYEAPLQALKAKGYEVESWPERNSAMFFALKMEKLVMTIFLALSALITSFSILTVLVLLVTQKRREIGILMALGLNAKQTRQVFAQVGIWLSMIGVVTGLALGIFICWLVDRFPMNLLPNIYYDRTIPAQVGWLMVLIIVLVAAVISILGSWFPAHLSTRSSPSQALRGRAE